MTIVDANNPVRESWLLVDGQWLDTGSWAEVRSPCSGQVVSRVGQGGSELATAAVDAAERAMREPLPAYELDVRAATALYAEDITMYSGNSGPIAGREAVGALMRQALGSLKGIRHEIHDMFVPGDDLVIARMTVHYELPDGLRHALPCCNTFRVRDGQVTEYQIYMDATPVWGQQ